MTVKVDFGTTNVAKGDQSAGRARGLRHAGGKKPSDTRVHVGPPSARDLFLILQDFGLVHKARPPSAFTLPLPAGNPVREYTILITSASCRLLARLHRTALV